MSQQMIRTPLTEHFQLVHPFILAGMSQAAGPELAAAVTRAGGLGIVGGVRHTPKQLRKILAELKELLPDKDAPFGVDLLLPKVGGNARKTNTSYTPDLPQLIDIIIESGAKLFVSAVGLPPTWVVDKLHENGIMYANIIGHPKHVKPALEAKADMIIYQAGEGDDGHTGDIPMTILAPQVYELCRGHKSPLTGKQIMTVAAGGIYNGRGLAAALSYGADGIWCGTRMVATEESGASQRHKEAIVKATYGSDTRTVIFTGRPMRVLSTPYIEDWESKPEKIKELTSKGIVPHYWAQEQNPDDDELGAREWPFLSGKCAAVIHDIRPAKDVIEDMTRDAVEILRNNATYLVPARL